MTFKECWKIEIVAPTARMRESYARNKIHHILTNFGHNLMFEVGYAYGEYGVLPEGFELCEACYSSGNEDSDCDCCDGVKRQPDWKLYRKYYAKWCAAHKTSYDDKITGIASRAGSARVGEPLYEAFDSHGHHSHGTGIRLVDGRCYHAPLFCFHKLEEIVDKAEITGLVKETKKAKVEKDNKREEELRIHREKIKRERIENLEKVFGAVTTPV